MRIFLIILAGLVCILTGFIVYQKKFMDNFQGVPASASLASINKHLLLLPGESSVVDNLVGIKLLESTEGTARVELWQSQNPGDRLEMELANEGQYKQIKLDFADKKTELMLQYNGPQNGKYSFIMYNRAYASAGDKGK